MKKVIFTIIKLILTSIYLLVLGVLSYYVYKLNIIPNKYLIIAYSFIGVISVLLILFLFKSRVVLRIISLILLIDMIIGIIIIIYYLKYFINSLLSIPVIIPVGIANKHIIGK